MADRVLTFDFSDGEWMIGGERAKDHVLKFGKGTGSHNLTFQIGTPAGRFRFNEADPIWVTENSAACPTAPSSSDDFVDIKLRGSTMLKVKNKNEKARRLRYQLNVLDSDGSSIPIDPIIDNGGKG